MIKTHEFLISKIKQALIATNLPINNETIIKSCCETILELINRNRTNYQDFYEIIADCISENTKLTEYLKKTINFGLLSNDSYLTVLKIIKALISFGNESEDLMKIITKHILNNPDHKGACNIIAKTFSKKYFNTFSLDLKTIIIKNSMEYLDLDLIEFLRVNKTHKDSDAIIQRYLDLKRERSEVITTEDLNFIVEIIETGSLKFLINIFYFNKNNFYKNRKDQIIKFNDKLLNLVRFEVLEKDLDGKRFENIMELFSLVSNFLLPCFSLLIKEINLKFLAGENRLCSVLRNIASYIKVEEFLDIIEPLNIKKHSQILKGLSNIDLSVFVDIYNTYANDETDSSSIHYILLFLPGFCNYCTDFNENIYQVLEIFKIHLPNACIFNSLEKLIFSHKQNLNENLCLNNPIPKEDSVKILSAIKDSKIIFNIINCYSEHPIDSLLEIMIDVSGLNIFPVLYRNIVDISYDFNDNNISCIEYENIKFNLYDSLRLMVFYVKNNLFHIDFISRIMDLCSSPESSIQKKAYSLLCSIYKYGSSTVCICDNLFTSLERTVQGPSLGGRIMLEYTILNKGCKTHIPTIKTDEMIYKFYTELVKGTNKGNIKCRKILSDIIYDLKENLLFIDFIKLNTTPSCPDPDLLIGLIETISCLIDFKSFDDYDLLFNTSMYSQDVIKPFLIVFTKILDESNKERIFSIVDNYIEKFFKKFNKQLREFCIFVGKKNINLSSKMKTLLRFKNKGGKTGDIEVVEKKDFSVLF